MKKVEKIEEKLMELPWYVGEYIHHQQLKMSEASILNYVHDYLIFFGWLVAEEISSGPMKEVPLSVLEKLKVQDIDNYQRHLLLYREPRENKKQLSVHTINRKLSSLKSLFNYLSNVAEDDDFNPYLQRNIMVKVKVSGEKVTSAGKAKRIEGKILRGQELSDFLHFVAVDYPLQMDDNKKLVNYHTKNKERDVALISLILGSGLRVSELAGLNVNDVDLVSCSAQVIRKGSKQDSVPFDNVAKQDLEDYLAIRQDRYKVDKSERALFLSLSSGRDKDGSTRFSVRAIQDMIKRYAKAYGKPLLSVHKLRHSFATEHYEQNKNLPLLSEIMGHESVTTTSIYNHLTQNQKRESVNRLNR
jgi:integrase